MPSPHTSDCAAHNMPAEPNGPCDCGVQAKMWLSAIKHALVMHGNCWITDVPEHPRVESLGWTTEFSCEIKAIDDVALFLDEQDRRHRAEADAIRKLYAAMQDAQIYIETVRGPDGTVLGTKLLSLSEVIARKEGRPETPVTPASAPLAGRTPASLPPAADAQPEALEDKPAMPPVEQTSRGCC